MAELAKTPWVATGWKGVIVNDANGNTLCVCPQGRDRDSLENIQANTRLIASAPDLLTALEALLSEFDKYSDHCRRYGCGHEDYGGQRESARAAIAKAKGQSAPAGWDRIEGDN